MITSGLIFYTAAVMATFIFFFFFSSRRRHTRSLCDWSSDVCSSDLAARQPPRRAIGTGRASMAWNQSSDDQDATTRRGAARSPKLGGWLRRWRQRWSANPGARSPYYAAAATAALALWLATGFYQVDDGERGVLQRFGAYAGLRGSGAGWHLPWPGETLTNVNLDHINSADVHSRMFTADAVLVTVAASIHYQYTDARAALFAVRESGAVVRAMGVRAPRELD